MKNETWEVIVQENIGMWMVDVYLIQRGTLRPAIAHIKNNELELTELKEGQVQAEPTLTLNRDAWNALKSAMVDKQEREKSTVESELTATKYHLEDMRKLLKLNPLT